MKLLDVRKFRRVQSTDRQKAKRNVLIALPAEYLVVKKRRERQVSDDAVVNSQTTEYTDQTEFLQRTLINCLDGREWKSVCLVSNNVNWNFTNFQCSFIFGIFGGQQFRWN